MKAISKLRNLSNLQIYLLVTLLLLPVMILRDFTPDNELRYLQIADEALDTGAWFAFTNHGAPYADKPPLYLWIVMAGKALFGKHMMWFLSIFSLVPAFVICEVMDRWTRRRLNRSQGIGGIFMLMSCGLFAGMMVILRMDMLMTMWIVLALYVAWRIFTGADSSETSGSLGSAKLSGAAPSWHRDCWLFGLYVFLGVFTKGPMAFLIPVVATFCYGAVSGRMRMAARCWNWRTWLILVGLCAIWWGLTFAEGGVEYINNLLFHQTMGRAVDSFHHKRPFWYYAAHVIYTFFPWSLLIIGTIGVASLRRLKRSAAAGAPKPRRFDALEKYFLTIVVSSFVLLSCISSKLDVYLLPVYPFAVYLTVLLLVKFRGSTWPKVLASIPAFILALAFPAVVVMLIVESGMREMLLLLVVPCVLLTGIALWSAIASLRQSISRGVALLALGIFATVFAAGFAMPQLNPYVGYGELAHRTSEVSASTGIADIRTAGVSRAENMDVYLGREVQVYPKDSISMLPAGHYILLTKPKLMDRLPDTLHVQPVDTVGPYMITIVE